MKKLWISIIALILAGCGQRLEFSPWSTKVDSRLTDLNKKNIEKIKSLPLQGNSFSFAFLGDTHRSYDRLEDVVGKMNRKKDIDFVIVGGDFTDQGLKSEYLLTERILSKLDKPFLVVIGNHDALSNGKELYKNMFGDFRFSFEVTGTKFIVWNANRWEFGEETTQFEWIEEQLKDRKQYKHVIHTSHIPPTNRGEFSDDEVATWTSILEAGKVDLSLHAHTHIFDSWKKNGVQYVVTADVDDFAYGIVTVTSGSVRYEQCKQDDCRRIK